MQHSIICILNMNTMQDASIIIIWNTKNVRCSQSGMLLLVHPAPAGVIKQLARLLFSKYFGRCALTNKNNSTCFFPLLFYCTDFKIGDFRHIYIFHNIQFYFQYIDEHFPSIGGSAEFEGKEEKVLYFVIILILYWYAIFYGKLTYV